MTVTEGERCRRTLAARVPADVVARQKNGVAHRLASRVKLKGFRSGKASVRIVEQRFGDEIERQTVDQLVRRVFRDAVAAHGLEPASDAEVDNVREEPGGGMSFQLSFDVQPTVVLQRLGGFRVERPEPPAADLLVDRFLEERRADHATWTPQEGKPRDGDSVTVEIARVAEDAGRPGATVRPSGDDGEDQSAQASADASSRRYDFVIGRDQALPAIEDAVRTLVPGTTGEFAVALPPGRADEALRGPPTPTDLRIALVERRAPVLPALDDTFAQDVAGCPLEEWKGHLRKRFGEAAEREADAVAHEKLVELVVDANDFEVPDSLVDACADAMLGPASDMDPKVREDLRRQIRPKAEFVVKRRLVLSRIADEHGLRARKAEVDAYVQDLAETSDESLAVTKAGLRKSGAMSHIERMITTKNVSEFLGRQSEITRAA